MKKVVTDETLFYEVSFLGIHKIMAKCGGVPPCIKILRKRHWLACKSGTITFFNYDKYHC